MGDQKDYLGGLEEVILLAVQALGTNAYGATIHEALNEAKRRLSIGSLYVTLSRLEEKGFLESHEGEPTPERGGRAKKFFRLTGTGVKALNETEEAREALRVQGRLAGGLA